jgi:hypothetical protein
MALDVQYSAADLDIDGTIAEAYEADPEGPIRIRVAPQVYVPKDNGGSYIAWKHVVWTMRVPTFADAQALREAMQTFFRLVGHFGPRWVLGQLQEAVKHSPAVPGTTPAPTDAPAVPEEPEPNPSDS